MNKAWFNVASWSAAGGIAAGLLVTFVRNPEVVEHVAAYMDWTSIVAGAVAAFTAAAAIALRKK